MGTLASHSANDNFIIQMGSEDPVIMVSSFFPLSTLKDDPQNCPLPAWQLFTLKISLNM